MDQFYSFRVIRNNWKLLFLIKTLKKGLNWQSFKKTSASEGGSPPFPLAINNFLVLLKVTITRPLPPSRCKPHPNSSCHAKSTGYKYLMHITKNGQRANISSANCFKCNYRIIIVTRSLVLFTERWSHIYRATVTTLLFAFHSATSNIDQ